MPSLHFECRTITYYSPAFASLSILGVLSAFPIVDGPNERRLPKPFLRLALGRDGLRVFVSESRWEFLFSPMSLLVRRLLLALEAPECHEGCGSEGESQFDLLEDHHIATC